MTQIVSVAAVATITSHGKWLIAASMYGKGKAFVGAHLLVKQQIIDEPGQYVALNLLAQGVEVTLKSLLLFRDYDKYSPKLPNHFGHNLVNTACATLEAFALKPLREPLNRELVHLSDIYARHLLRYGNLGDIFVAPSSIPSDQVLRRVAAAIRLANRELKRAG
jgi:hypothetical protein